MTEEESKLEEAVKNRVNQEQGKNVSQLEEDEGYKGIPYTFIKRCLEKGELGDGELFSELHRDKLVFNHQSLGWLMWEGHHWALDLTEGAKACVEDVADAYMAYRFECIRLKAKYEQDNAGEDAVKAVEAYAKRAHGKALKLYEEARRVATLKMARANRNPVAIAGDEIDRRPMLMPFSNGVVDLDTGDFSDGEPTDYLVKASKVEWKGIEEPCPKWEAFLHEIMGDDEETVEFLQRFIGYAATGNVNEQKFVVFTGQGRNGKGVFVELLTEVLGDFAGSIQSEMLLDQPTAKSASAPTPEIMDLRGLRVGFASETDDGRKFSASRVKLLSGDDQLVGRYPHDKRNVRFAPTHQLILMTNHKPHAKSDDFAFWQRMLLVSFPMSFVENPEEPNERPRNPNLKKELYEELPGIAAWIVRGTLLWKERGLAPSKRVLRETRAYQRNQDWFQDFLDMHVITSGVNERQWVTSQELHGVFEPWYKDYMSEKFAPKMKTVAELMKKKGFEVKRISRENGRKGYLGIKLKQAQNDTGNLIEE